MKEESKDLVREGLEIQKCLLSEIMAQQDDLSPDMKKNVKSAKILLKTAEELLDSNEQEAAETGLQINNLLKRVKMYFAERDLRQAIALFKEGINKRLDIEKTTKKDFRFWKRLNKLLDKASDCLDKGMIRRAKEILEDYHKQKQWAGPPVLPL